jgi:hypothetical protein
MEATQQFEVWREDLQPVLDSKVSEFHQLGYTKATGNEVWNCAIYQLRKRKEFIHRHAFVNIILTIRANEYMNWIMIDNYTTSNWLSKETVLEEIVKDRK